MIGKVITLSSALALASCANYVEQVKSQASFEFNCPQEQIKVTELEGVAFGAEGCGYRRGYTMARYGQIVTNGTLIKTDEESR